MASGLFRHRDLPVEKQQRRTQKTGDAGGRKADYGNPDERLLLMVTWDDMNSVTGRREIQ